jgi:lipoic acid synthetase
MRQAALKVEAGRIPGWLKSGLPDAYSMGAVARKVSGLGLNTICFEARCPNKRQCFQEGAVTFLILGRNCTRSCGFCNVSGAAPEPPEADEPRRLAAAASDLKLDYVVITSVTRDDLDDGGAGHYEACVRALGETANPPAIEVLTPDFRGVEADIGRVAASPIDVFAHNVETVERLYGKVRDRACYGRSLEVLRQARRSSEVLIVKSGLMLGMGETLEEVRMTLSHLRDAGCDIVSIGQYMRPSRAHLPVMEYIVPAVFDEIAGWARKLGLVAVCGPRVRSSFGAGQAYREAKLRRHTCA